MNKKNKTTISIIFGVFILALLIMTIKLTPNTDEEIVKCIGQNSVLYVQLGCPHCEKQEGIFGDNYKYINNIDCFFDRKTCAEVGIEATPTWIINGKKYKGIQSIEKLQELTGC